jgi:hypothetical protein
VTSVPRLRWVAGAAAVPGEGPGGGQRVGLDGMLAQGGRRARWAAMPGAAVDGSRGIRWPWAEQRDRNWWPQGVDVRRVDGREVVAISWHHAVTGVDDAARVSFIDLTDAKRPRFTHVLLVDEQQRPIPIHAGGLAWSDDRLLVADTFGGLRHFDVRDVSRVRHRLMGCDFVLPQSGGYEATTAEGERRMRYSFVSLEHGLAGPVLVAGEYRTGTDARLVRLPLDRDGATPAELHAAGLYRMQGVCVVDGTWYITTSNGRGRPGDLWAGTPGELARHKGVLPPGPEDLAREPGTRRLWSASEYPGSRWVFRIDPALLSSAE